MRKVFVFISIVAIATLFSSCATIVAGGDPSITISSSSVTEPVTITTEKQTYPNVTLPAVVQVKRKKLDGQRIRIEAENYKFQDIVLRKAVNGWAFGNILLGGIIGDHGVGSTDHLSRQMGQGTVLTHLRPIFCS